MELNITSRKTGETFSFWMNDNGGYVYLQTAEKPGTLGQQICAGGRTLGSTITAEPESFKAVCRRWYRAAQA